jgi:hypothetical protein|eukprot:COSAG01_NODE_1615_length_9724_cov_156.868725_14_plen_469_part_00
MVSAQQRLLQAVVAAAMLCAPVGGVLPSSAAEPFSAAISPAAARTGWDGWVWRPSWSWERLQTLTWGTNSSCCPYNGTNSHCCSLFENATELASKAEHDVIFQDNDLNMVGCRVPVRLPNGSWASSPGAGGMDTLSTCKAARSAAAGRIKAVAGPSKPVLDYRGIIVAWWNYETPEDASWWLKGDIPGSVPQVGVLDWRRGAVADYYVNEVIGLDTATDPNIDGVFVDSGFCIAASNPNMTYASRVALQLAELAVFERICRMMAAHGKVVAVSLKNHFSAVTDQQGMKLCPTGMDPGNTTRCMPFGEERVYEVLGSTGSFIPHRQFNIPSRDFGDAAHGGSDAAGCVAAVLNLQRESQRGPALITNNDGAMYSSTSTKHPGQTIDWYKAHNTSLAAFLMGMNNQSFFGSGMHWDDLGWNTHWPAFTRRLGKPLGPAVQQGQFFFTRSFEYLLRRGTHSIRPCLKLTAV